MRRIFLLLHLVLFSFFASAQRGVATGLIRSNDGKPVSFATVTIKGTMQSVASDVNGFFSIHTLTLHDILVVSVVGYDKLETEANTKDTMHVILVRNTQELAEVVVTGFGMTRRKAVSYSSSRVIEESISTSDKIGFKTWKRSGIEENSVRLAVGDKDYIPLKSVQVAVQIDGFRARILFDYFFLSDKDKTVRGNFKLKLPTGASPFYFAFGGKEFLNKDKMQIPFVNYPASTAFELIKDTIRSQRNNMWSNTKEAIVAPKEKASYAFNEVVRGKVDPALLEWAGADVFSCSVYPIQKNKLQRIVIGYDINLLEVDLDAVLNLELPYEKIENRLDIDIANTDGLQLQVEPLIENKNTIDGRIKYHLDNFTEKHFTISLRSETPVFLREKNGDKYFAVSYKPEIPKTVPAAIAEDAVFMLDVSLSSQPDKFNVWLKTMDGILKNNRKQIKRFAVLCFNVDAFWWRDFYTTNNDYNVDSFFSYASNLSLVGATDLNYALKEAAKPSWLNEDKTKPKTLFLLSDGDASWGENNLFQLSANIPATDKLFSFTTGFSETDTRILDHLSRQTNGAVFSVLNEDEVDKASIAIQSLPWSIKNISIDGGKDILVAGRPYFVFAGQKLIITGRGEVDAHSVILITLQQGTDEKTFTVSAAQIINSSLAARIYGQTAVNQLEDFSFKTEEASTKYAVHFAVPGQSCSLVMLESKQLYSRFGLDSIVTRHFIDSNLVTDIIQKVLADENAQRSLGSAKSDLIAWLKKMKRDEIIKIKRDSLFETNLNYLPELSFIVTVKQPKMDIYNDDQLYAGTLTQLNQSILDYEKLMRMINLEKWAEGKGNAFKLISSFAERNRNDLTLLREVAYTLSNWNLDSKAYELLKRIMLERPAEPATYTMIANTLVKMNYADLAMIYYDIAFLTKWDDRFEGFNLIAAIQYSRLLTDVTRGKYKVSNKSFAEKRLADVNKFLEEEKVTADTADIMIVITWNTDNTDVDLHVIEPSGEECYYAHQHTASGGFLSNDATQGFGPEMYFLKKAKLGKYHLNVEYYRSSDVQTATKSKVMVEAYKYWGTTKQQHYQKIVELKRSERKKNKRTNEEEDEDDRRLKDVLVLEF